MIQTNTILGIVIGYFIKGILDFFRNKLTAIKNQRKKLKIILFEIEQINFDINTNDKLQITVHSNRNASVPNFTKIKFFSIEKYMDLLIENDCGKEAHQLIDQIYSYNRSIELSYTAANFAVSNPNHLRSLSPNLLTASEELKKLTSKALLQEPLLYKLIIKTVPFLIFLFPNELKDK